MQKRIVYLALGPRILREILHRHPGVDVMDWLEHESVVIAFVEENHMRFAVQGVPAIEGPYGLVELMDNNPLVCAKRASCPGPAATLVLIALGPLARAEMLLAPPTITFNFDGGYDEINPALATEGWNRGYSIAPAIAPKDERGLEAIVEAPLRQDVAQEDVETLFEDLYARTFFIRPAGALPEQAIVGSPFARYEFLDFTTEPSPRIRIRVLADRHGKAGAAQAVHILNIMAGFEEDLGLTEPVDMEQFL